MKEWQQYADDYMVSQHPVRAFDYTGKKMTWKRAAYYTAFDNFFMGLKWAIGISFFLGFWTIFNEKLLLTFATNVCPLLK